MRAAAVAASAAVLLVGGWALAAATDGFEAFTTEAARRLRISRAPVQLRPAECLPDRSCELHTRRAVRVVDFIYTRCPTVCLALGGIYGELQRNLKDEIAAGRVELVSVGFDLEHDTPEALEAYRKRFGAVHGWRAIAPIDQANLRTLIDDFDLVILRDGHGGFTHNAGISVIDAHGRLSGVFDPESWIEAAHAARELMKNEPH